MLYQEPDFAHALAGIAIQLRDQLVELLGEIFGIVEGSKARFLVQLENHIKTALEITAKMRCQKAWYEVENITSDALFDATVMDEVDPERDVQDGDKIVMVLAGGLVRKQYKGATEVYGRVLKARVWSGPKGPGEMETGE